MDTILNTKEFKKSIEQALEALRTIGQQQFAETKDLLDVDQNSRLSVRVRFCLKKTPLTKNKIFSLVLKHQPFPKGSNIGLFVPDIDGGADRDYDPSIEFYKDILSRDGIENGVEIIPVKKLCLEYIEYESRRRLAHRFDVTIADRRLTDILLQRLGRAFFKIAPYPTLVKFSEKNIKTQFLKALRTVTFALASRGTTNSVRVGCLELNNDQLIDNILTGLGQLANKIPGGAGNFKNIHVFADKIQACLPIFVDSGDNDGIELPLSMEAEAYTPAQAFEVNKLAAMEGGQAVEGEISTLEDARVRVTADLRVHVLRGNKKDKREQLLNQGFDFSGNRIILDEPSETLASCSNIGSNAEASEISESNSEAGEKMVYESDNDKDRERHDSCTSEDSLLGVGKDVASASELKRKMKGKKKIEGEEFKVPIIPKGKKQKTSKPIPVS